MRCPFCGHPRSLRTWRIRGYHRHIGGMRIREHRCQGCNLTYLTGQRVLTVEDMEMLAAGEETP